MTIQTARIAIVGDGLSGLVAAELLRQRGETEVVVFEARDRLGGRIECVKSDGFDLGPAWFWPELQSQLDRLVRDLSLDRFKQHEAGDMVIERSPNEPPMRTRGYVSSPASMRLVGGKAELIDALHSRLNAMPIITGQAVRRLRSADAYVELDSEDAAGRVTSWRMKHVLLAVPPRLAAERIDFTPALPPALERQWRATATWMAPHAKYIATYDSAFWREHGLSGEARSARGPLGEIHDASTPGEAALFGFFGVPARVRQGVPESVLLSHCRAQLARLFGPRAATPKDEFVKDWAQDPWTATAADLDSSADHPEAPAATAASGPWSNRLTGIASEWSARFPGYLAGAVDAASGGVRALCSGRP